MTANIAVRSNSVQILKFHTQDMFLVLKFKCHYIKFWTLQKLCYNMIY